MLIHTTHNFSRIKFLDAGIQDVSTSISIVHDFTKKSINFEQMSPEDDDDGDENDKHI